MNINQAKKIVENLAAGDYYSVEHRLSNFGEYYSVYISTYGSFQANNWAQAIHKLENAIQQRNLRNRLPAPMAA